MVHHESKFFKDGLALAPDPVLVPFVDVCRPLLCVVVPPSSDDMPGSTLLPVFDGEDWLCVLTIRSTGYGRGGADPANECGGEGRAMLVGTSGREMGAGYGGAGDGCELCAATGAPYVTGGPPKLCGGGGGGGAAPGGPLV